MELAGIHTPGAAFVAGLVTSLHCAGMCGPLACVMAPGRGDRASPQAIATVYQLARLASYTALGAIAGAAGEMPLQWLGESAAQLLPWGLVLLLLVVAFRLERRLPKIPALARVPFKLQQLARGRSRLHVAAVMGAGTPLLPCGPLYFLVALAGFSGSALHGAESMLAFGLGTVPLLWLAQANFGRLRARLSPVWFAHARTAIALAAALVLAWRLRATLGFAGPDAATFICHSP